ncbi:hypothetical protein HY793_03505 [Candidatus Desantisbacteria bacterium]|nr:hypothetical protein [Candidatus Desantisbacteria bacterium]
MGNLIIKGSVSVTGSNPEYPRYGSIYVGKNVYIAGDIQYVNGPNWSAYPQWQQSAGTDYKNPASSTFNIANNDDGLPSKSGTSIMDTWVNNNTTTTLLSVSAKGGLVYGNYSTAVDHNSNYNNWVSNEYLFTMGSEDVGADGIPDTHDAGEGDNIPQLATEDLDGDGSVRMTDYNWKDVTTTGGNNYHSNPLNGFDGLRRDGGSTGPLWDPQKGDTINQYGETATNNINLIDGVYYTQHLLAGRVANSPRFHGSLISKDEAIVYSGTLNLIQDTRYHSNYRANPNFPIYLFPPGSVFTGGGALGKLQRVLSWKEIR